MTRVKLAQLAQAPGVQMDVFAVPRHRRVTSGRHDLSSAVLVNTCVRLAAEL